MATHVSLDTIGHRRVGVGHPSTKRFARARSEAFAVVSHGSVGRGADRYPSLGARALDTSVDGGGGLNPMVPPISV